MTNIPSVSPLFSTIIENQPLTHIWLTPSESQGKWWDMRIYRGFAWLMQNCGKTNGVESGRFWSILAKSLPTVSPVYLMWGNTKRLAYDYNSNCI